MSFLSDPSCIFFFTETRAQEKRRQHHQSLLRATVHNPPSSHHTSNSQASQMSALVSPGCPRTSLQKPSGSLPGSLSMSGLYPAHPSTLCKVVPSQQAVSKSRILHKALDKRWSYLLPSSLSLPSLLTRKAARHGSSGFLSQHYPPNKRF